ncbi:sugar ABC transporter permease [Candidatus Sumerlaeota bacterium]|nr:sugar ABC transporter permease [Candidatus Sumerlaeota bacterium]
MSNTAVRKRVSRKLLWRRIKENLEAFLYLSPAVSILFVFWMLPVAISIYISLTNWLGGDTFETVKFIGLKNYILAFHDEDFYKSLYNTFNYALYSVPSTIIIALVIAILLNQRIKFRSFFRTIYFLPFVTTWVAISIVWGYFYHREYGLANHILLNWLHLGRLEWLAEPRGIFQMILDLLFNKLGFNYSPRLSHPLLAGPSLSMVSILITSVWRDIGFFMVIFLAGLQNIDKTFYEAAEIDGASGWQKFRYITFPLLSPVTFFLLIISMIGAFKVFVPMFIMTPNGGPDNTTMTMVFYLYEKGFTGLWRLGYAAAIAYLLFAIILALTLIQNAIMGRRVHYETY